MMGYGTQTDDRNSAHHDYQGRGADLMPRLFVVNSRPSFIYFLYILYVFGFSDGLNGCTAPHSEMWTS